MSAPPNTLAAASEARAARLAALKSLKRKNPPEPSASDPVTSQQPSATAGPSQTTAPKPPQKDVSHLLSGSNYDPTTSTPKLGYNAPPTAAATTVEALASQISTQTLEAARKEAEESDGRLDITKLQPKKPNWDLKREVERRMEGLDAKTERAIVKLVRQGIEEKRKEKEKAGKKEEAGDNVEGNLAKLVEEREREGREEREGEEADAEEEEEAEAARAG